MQPSALSEHPGEQQRSGPGHRTRNATHRAGTPVNRGQVTKDTAHATQHLGWAHRYTGTRWPRLRTCNQAHRVSTPVNKSHVSQAPHKQHTAPSGHRGQQEPSHPGHHTRNTAPWSGTPLNRNQVAQDTAHATQRIERADPRTGAKWPRTPHTQHNAPSEHIGEQEPSRPGHRTRKTTHRAGTPVNRNQVAQDTAHARQGTKRAHR